MAFPDRHPVAGTPRFRTTRWSIVIAAGGDPSQASAAALARLCEAYWRPVFVFVRRRGYSVEDASDLTQGFFTRMLDGGYFARARPDRGRFRSFVLGAVTHFLANEADRTRALKRGGGVRPLPFEITVGEEYLPHEPRDESTPDRVFEQRWAFSVLEAALARLRAECVAARRDRLFDRLQFCLSGETPDVPYAQVARELGVTEGTIKVNVHRLRRRFGAILRDEIAQTVSRSDEIEAELRYLIKVVSG